MAHPFHSVPRKVFDELGDGNGGPIAVRLLASGQYSKHLHLLRGVLSTAVKAGHGQAAAAQTGFGLLADIQRRDPLAVHEVISYPSVGAWAVHTLRALRGGPPMAGAEPGALAAMAAAAAIRAGVAADIEVPSVGGLMMLPSLGAAEVDGGIALVRSGADRVTAVSSGAPVKLPDDVHRNAPGWLAVRQLRTGTLDVLIDDVDPFRMPDEPMVTRRLGDADLGGLGAALQDGWSLLARCHPDTAAELAAAIRTIVPLVTPSDGHISASSAETFGAVALSRPPDARALAATLVHEVQHLKLSALSNIVTLTLPDGGRRFYAPWRDDPRPASGLLQGAYAYVGVSRFWLRQRQLDHNEAGLHAHAEFTRWRAAVLGVVETLKSSGLLTVAGADFVRRMAQTLRAWQDEAVPREAQALADRAAGEHLSRWESANGPVSAWLPR